MESNYQNDRQKMLFHNIKQLQVATLDAALFLDTHPNDPVALYRHNAYSTQLRRLREEYEMMYGLLNCYNPESGETWRYINSPWPWESM